MIESKNWQISAIVKVLSFSRYFYLFENLEIIGLIEKSNEKQLKSCFDIKIYFLSLRMKVDINTLMYQGRQTGSNTVLFLLAFKYY